MSETVKPDTPDIVRMPDNIIKSRRDGTTYIIREFMVGKEQAADIVARRVIRALEPDVPMR